MSEERMTMSTVDYLKTPENNRPRELAYGIVREPPAPFFSHQSVVLQVARLLCDHVDRGHLGKVAVAPVDVVLDRDRALIVQPDVLFVSTARLSIIRDQVWGAPDLVVEVLSHGTEAHDRREKLEWYRQYGVAECWLVDPAEERVVVVDLTGPDPVRRESNGPDLICSAVLPSFHVRASLLFV
jgi:Uma2 family endonuclease